MDDFAIEAAVLAYLDQLSISYDLVRHAPALTIADLG